MTGFVPLLAARPRVNADDARRAEEAKRERLLERIAIREAELDRLEAERAAAHAAAMEDLARATAAAEAAEREHREATSREDAAAERLDQAAALLLAARSSAVAEVRDHAAAVILDAARRIAGDALHADPLLLDALVGAAVDALGKAGLTVRAAPGDVDGLRERWEGLEVVPDATVEAGCVCTGPAGQVDASLGVAVAAVRGVLDTWRTS